MNNLVTTMKHDDASQPIASTLTPEANPLRRLHALGRVGIRVEVCITGRLAGNDCHLCADACPPNCLSVSEGTLALDPVKCTNCGLCAAACPTGALTVEGFELPDAVPPGGLLLKCERSRAATVGPEHPFPCLGGLALEDWLALALSAAGAPLRILDDDACKRCPTALNTEPPWAATLETSRLALTAAGMPKDALPSVVKLSTLPNGNRAPATDRDHAVVAGRRRFFTGLSRSLVSSVARTASASLAPTVRSGVPRRLRGHGAPHRGEQTPLLLQALARRHQLAHPRSALLSRVEVIGSCQAHGTCTRICPTDALQLVRREDEAHTELRFDAWRCIDCGACAAHCPEQALRHKPRDWQAFTDVPLTLAVVAQHACPRCGAAAVGVDKGSLCDRCNKSENLARAGFALFHRHHLKSPALPEGP